MDHRWDKAVLEDFRRIIEKMPVFLRPMAEKRISEKAAALASEGGRDEISEKDLVDALFSETPFGFQGLMKNDLSELGIDYTKYGYGK